MKRLMLATLAFFLSLTAYAQNEILSVPYVSGLRAEVEGSSVKLLWLDTNIAGARYVIYRYGQQISEADWQKAKRLAVVPAGQESYVDQPTAKGSYYYAVLVMEPSGQVKPLFIPFRNVTTEAVSVTTLVGERPAFADVTNLTATRAGSSVELSFKSSRSGRQLVVYRSTAPIDTTTELLGAVSVGVISSSQSSFEDKPVPGIPYYYALVDSSMLASGKVTLVPGQNATRSGIVVPLPSTETGQIEFAPKRPRPLPFLPLTANPETGAALPGANALSVPEQAPLSKTTADAVKSLITSLPAAPKEANLHAVVLDADKGVVSGGGEEYALKNIIDGPFKAGDWKQALDAFRSYLRIPHSKNITARAHFYLAQTYYFTGDYRQSLLEFVLVEDLFYPEVQPWLDTLFAKLRGATQPQS